ncbi:MAG: tRNA preQ1(34) S-adenosylmethionine ribosyltransferase-isomerase QueA [Kiritimatiellia bacterium]|nr:tRNA preQ1(34) S-adenosylmethionine ribosyltransferase-isomerase QueA [Kiritimatiellia bacterium]
MLGLTPFALLLREFDYHLPAELIAQEPAPDRAQARLMLVCRATGKISHYRAADLPFLLQKGDLMVLNDTRVIPARVFGKKQKTGGKVEVLFIEESEKDVWEVLLHAAHRPRMNDILLLANNRVTAQILSTGNYGRAFLKLNYGSDLFQILEEEGLPPLPPYIKRPRNERSTSTCRRQRQLDSERYQTVYARVPGAVAAPTAGLHLSNGLLDELERTGIQRTEVTLHVGPGTFIPVRCEQIEDHKMESERFIISSTAARKINETVTEKRRIIAVGTTVVRALESAVTADGKIAAGKGRTEIFIYPPYQFRIIGALLTNFHLPRSTLLMLVSAFACPQCNPSADGLQAGRELIRHAYETAVKEKYRFYSYGDCMLII